MLDDLSARLAENLRRLREARGLTQQDLSAASGVPRPTLAHLESGSANPTLSVIARVAHALSVPMEELVAQANANIEFRPSKSLPRHERSGARVVEVCPEPPSGIVVERIELSHRAELVREGSRQADRIYVVCERGELDVGSGEEHCALKAGDLAMIRRGAPHVITQRGRSAAVAYSVRIGAWSG
ncbi:MAG TPA: XRE family transcriptional regulator [Polyangiaceae bacterium]|nr:XRE family transcriptional regulator [Polyangiaceae bacterium]